MGRRAHRAGGSQTLLVRGPTRIAHDRHWWSVARQPRGVRAAEQRKQRLGARREWKRRKPGRGGATRAAASGDWRIDSPVGFRKAIRKGMTVHTDRRSPSRPPFPGRKSRRTPPIRLPSAAHSKRSQSTSARFVPSPPPGVATPKDPSRFSAAIGSIRLTWGYRSRASKEVPHERNF